MTTKEKILSSLQPVIENSKYVSLDKKQLVKLAKKLLAPKSPEWDNDPAFGNNEEDTLHFYFFVDNLNFLSWPEKGKEKWSYHYNDEWISGYYGRLHAIKMAFTHDKRFFDAHYLAEIPYQEFVNIFKGRGGMQLMKERHQLIQECFTIIVEKYQGKVINLVHEANCDANIIVNLLVDFFPRFRDIGEYNGKQVYFLKLAQIIPNDFNNVMKKSHSQYITNTQDLTIFADTLIPQLLEAENVLVYSKELIEKLKNEELIQSHSQEEMEIRAYAIYACELLRDELEKLGRKITSNELDWILWTQAKQRTFSLPYHRTVSIFY